MKTKKSPSTKHAFDPYEFEKIILDGTEIYWKNISTSPCIHVNVCFNVGCLHDPRDRAGLSHFLEHMIFDGSLTLPTKKDIIEWSKLYALNSWNAWTYFTNTNYHLRCLPEHFETVLTGMQDMIFHPLLKPEDVEHERSVITQEAWGRYKNEKYLAYYKEMNANQFRGTVKEHIASPLGWPDTVTSISQEDVATWHTKNYGKGNFFMVIAGPLTKAHLGYVKKFLQDAPTTTKTKLMFGTLSKPKQLLTKKTGEEIGDPKEQVEISIERIMKPADAPHDQVRRMSESLLRDILFERLRTERALCYGVSVGSNLQRDFLLSGINIEADEENTDTIIKELWKAISDITVGLEKKRFDTLKKVNVDRLKSKEEITQEIVSNTLFNLTEHGKISTSAESIRAREKVTYADVSKYLAKVFDRKWIVTEIITPVKR